MQGAPKSLKDKGDKFNHANHHQAVRRAFSRLAEQYNDNDFLAQVVHARMAERLDYLRIKPQVVADIGCGAGRSLPELARRYPQAQLLALDQSTAMLQAAERYLPVCWLGGEAESLPFASASLSFVWSNLLLAWVVDPSVVLGEVARVLSNDGLLMFSTLGLDSLQELRHSFSVAEQLSGLEACGHTQHFYDMHDLGDLLLQNGFADPVMDMEKLTFTYSSFEKLVGELRAAGGCVSHGRRRGLSGKSLWRAVKQVYETYRLDGRLPVSVEVIYGHAWKSAPGKISDDRDVVRFFNNAGGNDK